MWLFIGINGNIFYIWYIFKIGIFIFKISFIEDFKKHLCFAVFQPKKKIKLTDGNLNFCGPKDCKTILLTLEPFGEKYVTIRLVALVRVNTPLADVYPPQASPRLRMLNGLL